MDALYQNLIYDFNLYTPQFIETFGVESQFWNRETWKNRELSLRHDKCCALLCNMETLDPLDILEKTRKRAATSDPLGEPLLKRRRDDNAFMESNNTQSNRSSSDETYLTVTEDLYRLILIEGMPQAELLQNNYSQSMGIPPPDALWDLIDLKLKKFIEVKVSKDLNGSLERYKAKVGDYKYGCLCVINPVTNLFYWFDHPGGLKGETKVKSFLASRKSTMDDLGILETDMEDIKDLYSTIFVSNYMNKFLEQWEGKMSSDVTNLTENMALNKVYDSRLTEVTPTQLLMHLDNLENRNDCPVIRWRGKISPEGLTQNILLKFSTDYENCVELSHLFISSNLTYYGEWDNENNTYLLPYITKIIIKNGSTSFNLKLDTSIENESFKRRLGVGMKKRSHLETDANAEEPTYTPLQRRQYHTYFDNIIRLFSKDHTFLEGQPLSHMEKDIITTSHPISIITNRASRELLERFSKANVSVYASKMSGFYSRLGGSYLQDPTKTKTNHSSYSAFPIVTTIYDCIDEKTRYASGICIRGPQHAKSPTDKIGFLMVEVFPNNDDSKTYLRYQGPISIYYNRDIIVSVRQNSILKEDCSYLTFANNALFVPFNTLGVMTLENQSLKPDANMLELIDKTIKNNGKWLLERYVEGIIMASVGNTRDEGYLALLRKLYMVILTWRRKRISAHWDIEGFCTKMNECLIDNPFSMHFHKTLLKLLLQYQIEYSEIEGGDVPI